MTLADKGFVVIRGALTGDGLKLYQHLLKQSFLHRKQMFMNRYGEWRIGDDQCDKRWSLGRQPVGESLLYAMKDVIQEAVGVDIIPSYSFPTIYAPGAVLKKHIDRYACELTCTMAIEYEPNTIWSIYLNDPLVSREHVERVDLAPGDILVFDGSKKPHWREELNQDHYSMNVFLHYAYKDGPMVSHAKKEDQGMYNDISLEHDIAKDAI